MRRERAGFALVGAFMIMASVVAAGFLGLVVLRAGGVFGDTGSMAAPAQAPPSDWLDQYLHLLSGGALMAVLQARGITDYMLTRNRITLSPSDGYVTQSDTPTGTAPNMDENEPSIAVNPTNPRFVVAAYNVKGDTKRCAISRSIDGGITWSPFTYLPLRYPSDNCLKPVVRYSPNGAIVYAAYISIRTDGSTADIVVCRSTNNGASWCTTPVVAIYGVAGITVDEPWIDVHRFFPGSNTNNKVYITATMYNFLDQDESSVNVTVVFSRSTNGGLVWSTPIVISNVIDHDWPWRIVYGARPIGGKAVSSSVGHVLVCWYDSDNDGWLAGFFDIRCRSSEDYGATWNSEVTAVDNMPHELTYWLGPDCHYHKWWHAMLPSIMIGPDGVAHIVYTADLTPSDIWHGCRQDPFEDPPDPEPEYVGADEEAGDIFYVRSPGYPYDVWSFSYMVSRDNPGYAQGYATVNVKVINGVPVVFVAWLDHRVSFWTGQPNSRYAVYAAWTWPGKWGRFTDNIAISDIESDSDVKDTLIDRFIDSATSNMANDPFIYLIWTDRSDKYGTTDPEDDVWMKKVPLP